MFPYDDDGGDDEGERSPRTVVLGGIAVLVVLLALGWFIGRPLLDGDDEQTGSPLELAESTEVTGAAATSTDDEAAGKSRVTMERASTAPDTSASETTESASTDAVTTSTARVAPTTTAAPTTVARTTVATTTTQPATYDSLPDGSPVPVVAIFDMNTITLAGAVPSQAAVERLSALAIANSKTPATVDNRLTINPAVPINVGVRVIELTSARFPEGSAEVLPDQAAEFDRVVAVMNALPQVTALVIGHADQRGDELSNFALSEERARAAVTYIAGRGIAPSRLASRAVGESDLLSINDDAAALALNRRTEFVFYGLLLE